LARQTREGKSVVQLSLPIILGSDSAGIVDSVGTGVIQFKPGDELFGVTNKQFFGAYAECAVAQMVVARPRSLSFVEAASVPVVAAYQMLFDYAMNNLVGMVSEKSITRQQAGRFRRAKNEPSARRGLAGGCSGHKILESRDEGELGYASVESKSKILL
jgi:hypothetical protein